MIFGNKDTKLFNAARDGKLADVIRLLDKGANANKFFNIGHEFEYSARAVASKMGHVDIIQYFYSRFEKFDSFGMRSAASRAKLTHWRFIWTEVIVKLMQKTAMDLLR